MPHQIAYKRLSRTDAHRRALLRNLATSFFKHGKIETTTTKLLSETEDTDLAKAILDLTNQQNTYQAALRSVTFADLPCAAGSAAMPSFQASASGFVRLTCWQ